jgi:hypothetical protein
VTNEETQLGDQDLSARLGDLDSKIMIQLRRAHRLPDNFTELAPPLSLFHNAFPGLLG